MLEVHRPYPGVALLVTQHGSVLLGAPADAFKATKDYCKQHNLPFPRVLVAPQRLVAHGNPQFVPEFFLYDFLFVYGAAFKPELERERLQLVVDSDQVEDERRALWTTLSGPSRADLGSYKDAQGRPLVSAADVALLANISEHLAIKKAGRTRTLEEMIETPTFGKDGAVALLGGTLRLARTGPVSFVAQVDNEEERVDLEFTAPVRPFNVLPVPLELQPPQRFAVKALGTRSGFDLSGPTTGFLLWVNGRAVIYDGPVGTRYLLERQGISPSDIDAVILSHCHEDHMAGFVELIIAGQRPRVLTAEPIYRSTLIKLAHHFRLPEAEVATFIDYHRVTPGEPLVELGATFEFFYTAHAIPTIGMRVSMKDASGTVRRLQISGDTMNHEGLEKMRAAGVVEASMVDRLRNLVPAQREEGCLYFADVGEAMIHGNPKDWQGNPNRIIYYHCPDDDRLRSFGHEVAQPGKSYTLIQGEPIHPAIPGRLMHALKFLNLTNPAWLSHILFRGRVRRAEAGTTLAEAGRPSNGLAVIVSGSAAVLGRDGQPLFLLRPGELFGLIELADREGRYRHSVRAETPIELFEIDADLFHEYTRAAGLEPQLMRLGAQRPIIDGAAVFCSLDLAARSQLAVSATSHTFEPREAIIEQGSVGDDFFVLAEGTVSVETDGRALRDIRAGDEDNFFGEASAVHPNRPRQMTVRAKTAVRVLRIRGRDLRALYESETAVRYALTLAMSAHR